MREWFCVFVLSFAHPVGAAVVECSEVRPRGSEPPLELWVGIESPAPGAVLRSFQPDCLDVELRASVSAVGPSPSHDFYLLIDRSGSTVVASGADIDGDGLIAPADPEGDSVLDAEIAAARLLVDALDLGRSRLSIVRFAQAAVGLSQVEQGLTDDRTLLHAALDRIALDGSNLGTDLRYALRLALDEHDRAADPARRQVLFLLSDGRPTAPTPPFNTTDGDEDCNGGRDICAALEQADAAALRGVVIHSFALGASADLSVLGEISRRTDGRLIEVDRPADVRELLPGLSSVGVREALVENSSTGESRLVAPAPDGALAEIFSLVEGRNDLRVSVVAETDPPASLACATDATRRCISWSCPDDRVVECDGDLSAGVELVAEVDDADVLVSNDSPADDTLPLGDADASGRYPLGATEIFFLFEDSAAGMRTCSTRVDILDTQRPWLEGVPPDETVECPDVPPPPSVRARDACDPAPILDQGELRIDGPCPGTYELLRTFQATDAVGLRAGAEQRIQVVDSTPPLVRASSERLACLWPPNHRFVRIEASEFAPVIEEGCSVPISWTLTGCESDEPENGLGDGNTEPDCVVLDGGQALLVRAERQGLGDGRDYSVSIVAEDACGNRSAPTSIGVVHVPHDRRGDRADCLRGTGKD